MTLRNSVSAILLGAVLTAVLCAGCQSTPPPERTRLQRAMADMQSKAVRHYELGEYTLALETLEKMELLCKGTDNLEHLANVYNNISAIYFELKNYEAVSKYLLLALDLNGRSDTPAATAGEAENNLNLGSLYIALGDHTKAEKYNDAAEKIFLSIGDQNGLIQVTRNRGKIQMSLSDFTRAITLYSEALEKGRSIGDYRLTAGILADIGSARENMGEYERALDLYRQALDINKKNEQFIGVAKDLFVIGRVFERMSKPAKAMEYHLRALNVYRIRIGHKPWIIAQLKKVLALAGELKDKEALTTYGKMLKKYRG